MPKHDADGLARPRTDAADLNKKTRAGLSSAAPVGTPLPELALVEDTGRCPTCGFTDRYPRPWPAPWRSLYAGPARCPWDGDLMRKVQ